MDFSFSDKVSMRMNGFTRDEIAATERAWAIVPEAVEMLLAEHGTQLWFNGQLTNVGINFGEDVALLADGTPVVLRVAQGHNDFPWHEIYNPDGVEAYREAIFQREYAVVKAEKRAEYAAQQAQLGVSEEAPTVRPMPRRLTDGEQAERDATTAQMMRKFSDEANKQWRE